MVLGFSTGCLYKSGNVRDALRLYRALGIKAVELGFLRMEQLSADDFKHVLTEDLGYFDYVSLHTQKFPYQKDKPSLEIIAKIKYIHSVRPLDRVVVHPDPVKDFSVWAESGLNVGIENMDCNKPSGRTPQDIKKILDQYPEFGFVLDVNHIWTNDPTMRLADAFFEKLGDRLVQYHVSGFRELHDPIFETEQVEIIQAVRDLSHPIIVESLLTPEKVALERDYIMKFLK